MKFTLLCVFALIASGQVLDDFCFRFKDAKIIKGDKQYTQAEGTILEQHDVLGFMGMHMPSFTPFLVIASAKRDLGSFVKSYTCSHYKWGKTEFDYLTGSITMNAPSDHGEIKGNCKASSGVFSFIANSTQSKIVFYEPKEAGRRAKILIGQSTEKFRTTEVILYAIIDLVDSASNNCEKEFESFPAAEGPGPGIIILGRKDRHCAILDNEGTKFVHSHSSKKEVRYESVSLINTYFPNGHEYKKYPKYLIPSLQFKD